RRGDSERSGVCSSHDSSGLVECASYRVRPELLREVPRESGTRESAGDAKYDADFFRKRGSFADELPATQRGELAQKVRVRLARDRQLDDRALVTDEAPVLDAAESGQQPGEILKGRVSIRHGQATGDVWRHEGGCHRRCGGGPGGLQRVDTRLRNPRPWGPRAGGGGSPRGLPPRGRLLQPFPDLGVRGGRGGGRPPSAGGRPRSHLRPSPPLR